MARIKFRELAKQTMTPESIARSRKAAIKEIAAMELAELRDTLRACDQWKANTTAFYDTLPDSRRAELKTVGRSGQISLGKRYAGKTLRLERFQDGRIVLTAVAMVPESQLWALAEPDRSRIERGLDWAAKTSPAETDLDALLKRRPRKAARQRARRI